jgi:arabinofuranosyltransferase
MPLRVLMGRLCPFVLACGVGAFALAATWFLCDDAYIAFRYVGNAYDGHGLVWNEAPWRPVEGYSSFLWAVLLLVVWQGTGIAPPESANVLAAACGLVSLGLVARRLHVLPLSEKLVPHRPVLATLALVTVASSHSWITWQSSGLDAALFGMLAIGWTLAATAPRDGGGGPSLTKMAGWAAVAQLARPDGALLILATLGLALFTVLRERTGARLRATLLAMWPFVFVAAHLAWRRSFYGEWVPNTYFAKVVEPWPESGLRYLACFVFEHGIWLWLPPALVWALRPGGSGGRWRTMPAHAPAVVAVATWFAYVGYYTLRVGGDHFGYRPFMHLLPLACVALLVFARDLGRGPRTTIAALVGFGVAGNSFGWWYEAQLRGREASSRSPTNCRRCCGPCGGGTTGSRRGCGCTSSGSAARSTNRCATSWRAASRRARRRSSTGRKGGAASSGSAPPASRRGACRNAT